MKKLLKILIKFPLNVYFLYLNTLKFLNKRSYNYLNDLFVNSIQNKKKIVNLYGKKIHIYTPNQLCEYRANTFFSKEPETINWIDKYGKKSVLYDIGANIGLYSNSRIRPLRSSTLLCDKGIRSLNDIFPLNT